MPILKIQNTYTFNYLFTRILKFAFLLSDTCSPGLPHKDKSLLIFLLYQFPNIYRS